MQEKRPMTENLGTFQNLGAESVAGGVRSGCEEWGAPGPSQAPCVMGSDVVIPRLDHLSCSFVLAASGEPCPTRTWDPRDLSITRALCSVRASCGRFSLGCGLGLGCSPHLLDICCFCVFVDIVPPLGFFF